VYVHFPWCLAKCPYCDFVSYATERANVDHAAYADAVLRELALRKAAFEGRTVATVFFGGGTPSLWEPRQLGRVLAGVRGALRCEADLEVTVECNPTSLDPGRAAALRDEGVNRLSIGVQSLRDDHLRYLGRLHDADGALRAIDAALASGIDRVSADLIFGLPDQPPDDARDQAGRLAARGLKHLSCYQLTIEPGTRFGELARRGRLPMADEGRVVAAFAAIDAALEARGLRHYEISNYAEPGEEARHNLGYWRGDEYLGLGCGAYGFAREPAAPSAPAHGHRYRNVVEPARYFADPGREASREALDAGALLRERIMLGLRLRGGFDLAEAGRALGIDPWTAERRRAAGALAARNRLEISDGRLSIPRDAWVFTDDTAARLF
jgi:oxygen-independent coproporphyrinogen-3 oxidase